MIENIILLSQFFCVITIFDHILSVYWKILYYHDNLILTTIIKFGVEHSTKQKKNKKKWDNKFDK